jgi:hypothetical protein
MASYFLDWRKVACGSFPRLEKIACGAFFKTLHRRPAAKSVVFAAYVAGRQW